MGLTKAESKAELLPIACAAFREGSTDLIPMTNHSEPPGEAAVDQLDDAAIKHVVGGFGGNAGSGGDSGSGEDGLESPLRRQIGRGGKGGNGGAS